MVAQGNLVAAQFPGFPVQIPPAHLGAQVAGGILHMEHRFEDFRGKEGEGHLEQFGVFLDDLPVHGIVPRIHAQEHQVEGNLVVALQVLEQLGHKHGILASGNAHGNLVPGLDHGVITDGLDEFAGNPPFVFPAQGGFDPFQPLGIFRRQGVFPFQPFLEPQGVAPCQGNSGVSLVPEIGGQAQADLPPHAHQDDEPVFRQVHAAFLERQGVQVHGAGHRAPVKGRRIPDVRQEPLVRGETRQFLHGDFSFVIPLGKIHGHRFKASFIVDWFPLYHGIMNLSTKRGDGYEETDLSLAGARADAAVPVAAG